RVDRAVRKVAADVGPALPAVGRLEDVAGLGWRCGIESGVRGVRDAVVARIDRELGYWPLRQLAIVETCPGRAAVHLRVGADVDEAVERARVHGLSATDADRGDVAVRGPFGGGTGDSVVGWGRTVLPLSAAGVLVCAVAGAVC